MSNKLIQLLPTDLQKPTLEIAELIKANNGRALLVGGCVRDALLGLHPKDIDIEVYHIDPETLHSLLKKHFPIVPVGKAFGVLKFKHLPIDVSIPRTESKSAPGHKGFKITGDPHLSFEKAAARRDFTINAIYYDPLIHEVVDPFNGQKDLKDRTLRHTSHQFSEDPLRPLRAMQLIGRFELSIHPDTLKLCQSVTPETLPKERLFDEWKKLITKSTKPSIGLNFLKDSGWIQYYPELHALIDCKQDPEWHPEGDVWVHTLHCLDDFAGNRVEDEWEDLIVGLAVLLHDVGKPATSYTDEEGRIRSPRHDLEGVPIAEKFLRRLTDHQDLIDAILPLVETHMRHIDIFRHKSSDSSIRRLVRKIPEIQRLMRVVSADMGGRPPLGKEEFEEDLAWFNERLHALDLQDNAPTPIILGRHLIERGMLPSPDFKPIIEHCFNAQLDGEFTTEEEAFAYLDKYLQDYSK